MRLDLLEKHPLVSEREEGWRLVEDVLARRIKSKAASAAGVLQPATNFNSQASWQSDYLPKGKLEPASEYSLRVQMTPFLPETPHVMQSRLGALLKTPPQSSWPDIEALTSNVLQLVQVHGYVAASTENGSDRQGIQIHPAPTIWHWAPDFSWVKFVTCCTEKPLWNSAAVNVTTVKIIDTVVVSLYRIWLLEHDPKKVTQEGWSRIVEDGWVIETGPVVPHDQAATPVFFNHPFPGMDGLGLSVLGATADADIAATRVSSDLTWNLFLLGNPILTWKHNRPLQETKNLEVGASRYVELRAGRPGVEEPEVLEFCQLDATGMKMQFEAYELWNTQAKHQGGISADDASGSPKIASGVSQAWTFKTGEERVLQLLARSTEQFLERALSSAAGTAVSVVLDKNFDLGGTKTK